jgi:5'-3' exonuclease
MWESRYYKSLFSFERTVNNIEPLCLNYLEGLEWVYKYYTSGCPDWKWKYNYNYPPLFSDLCKHIPTKTIELIKPDRSRNKPFSPYAQLSYVLPYSNLNLLPEKKREYLIQNCSEFYAETYDFQWAFCRYFWESHPLLPDISLDKLSELDDVFKEGCFAN